VDIRGPKKNHPEGHNGIPVMEYFTPPLMGESGSCMPQDSDTWTQWTHDDAQGMSIKPSRQ